MESAEEFYRKTASLHESFQEREMKLLRYEKSVDGGYSLRNKSTREHLQQITEREKESEQVYKNAMDKIHKLNELINSIFVKKPQLLKQESSEPQPVCEPILRDVMREAPPVLVYVSPEIKDNYSQTEFISCAECQQRDMQNSCVGTNDERSKQPERDSFYIPIETRLVGDQNSDLFYHANEDHLLIKNTPVKEEKRSSAISFKYKPLNIETTIIEGDLPDPGANSTPVEDNLPFDELQDAVSAQFVSKSDDESINHEFDFLDLNKFVSSGADETIGVATPEKVSILQEIAVIETKPEESVNTAPKSFMKINVSTNSKLNNSEQSGDQLKINLNRNDSSVSEDIHSSTIHSEHNSVASDSDSIFEKETQLTATAAYKVMLNSERSRRMSQKDISSSDSESDEVESALISAVRKSSSVTPDAKLQTIKASEEKEEEPDSKHVNSVKKKSLPFINTKPQSKLSKTTRKILLGLDASSGSDVELDVAPATKQNDEDSDEFYN